MSENDKEKKTVSPPSSVILKQSCRAGKLGKSFPRLLLIVVLFLAEHYLS